jgi:hypothetical protein
MFWFFVLLAGALVFLGIGNTFRLIGTLIGLILLGALLYVGSIALLLGIAALL